MLGLCWGDTSSFGGESPVPSCHPKGKQSLGEGGEEMAREREECGLQG